MSIQQKLREQMKDALRAKDKVHLSVIRGLLTECMNELVSQKKKPNEELPDTDVLKVIRREVKKRKDSIEQFRKANRQDLVESEQAELAILDVYLPAQMSEEQILDIIDRKKAEMNITDTSKMGIFMGAVMKETGGNADGNVVKQLIEKSFL